MTNNKNLNKNEHIRGKANARIEFVEYGDYECVECRDLHYELVKIRETLGDDFKFIFRNFPRFSIHHHSYNAAITAEIAAKYDKFWEMHDLLFKNQEKLSDSYLINYAISLGINQDDFVRDFDSGLFMKKLQIDVESGIQEEISTTPAIFINNIRYLGDINAESILSYISENF